MENGKLFEFMEKMYSDLTTKIDSMSTKLGNMSTSLDTIETKQEEGFKKFEIEVEGIKTDIKQLSEIQDNQCQANDLHHAEIVEMLTERLDIQDKAIRNITIAK